MVTRSLGHWHPKWKVTKFHDETGIIEDWKKFGHSAEETIQAFPDEFTEVKEFEFNGLTQTGLNILWQLLIGNGATTPFNNTNARLGVSNDQTAFFNTQTNLNPTGSADFYMQLMDSGYPQVSSVDVIFEATFGSSIANQEWLSFGVDNDGVDGAGDVITSYSPTIIGLLNRYLFDIGTKVDGDIWILTLMLEIT